jgi:hypothetical protein
VTIEEITARLRSRDCAMEWEIAAADTIDALKTENAKLRERAEVAEKERDEWVAIARAALGKE